MHQNSFKQQLASTLNPDSVYQTHFAPQHAPHILNHAERNSITGR